MRNPLKKINKIWEIWSVRFDGMIHPGVAADNFLAPLHRSFLTSCFLSGTAALFILPLHLALAGAPHAATILVLAWMLGQWPIAHYLSRTGALNTAVAVSSGLFACFVAAICLMSGGAGSFALLWLLIPPFEAAFATNRKTPIAITALCCALLAAVTLLSDHVPQAFGLNSETRIVASVAALIYAGLLAARFSSDRARARAIINVSESRRRHVCSHVAEVLCELSPSGRMSVLGGPVRDILGFSPTVREDDWLFHRLHVADRPYYLTKLADAKKGGNAASIDVRLRVGPSHPGDTGQATYRDFGLTLRPADAQDAGGGPSTVILSLRKPSGQDRKSEEPDPETDDSRGQTIRWNVFEEAGVSVQAQVNEIVDLASVVEKRGKLLSEDSLHQTAVRIRSAGDRSARSLTAMLDLLPKGADPSASNFCRVDVADCLNHSSNLIRPLADRLKVGIEVQAAADLPDAFADKKKFRQSLHLILSELVETTGAGGIVHVSVEPAQDALKLVLTAVNRQSSLTWSSSGSEPLFDRVARLLEETGADLKIQSALGHGESVVVSVPVRSGKGASVDAAGDARQLARTA